MGHLVSSSQLLEVVLELVYFKGSFPGVVLYQRNILKHVVAKYAYM